MSGPVCVPGFRFAGVAAGIKESGRPDLGLVLADDEVPVAALFTKNRVKAAPVVMAQRRTERGLARAVLVNSGNANACTGKDGLTAARRTSAMLARAVGTDESLVIPASTGVIGRTLPVERIERAIPRLVADLSEDGVERFAVAIMTTDRWPKIASARVRLGAGREATVLGVAKGAGMIHPDMATTLAFVVTDAKAHSAFLKRALRIAADASFNAITVDGETSTNDTLLAIASGAAGGSSVRASDRDGKKLIAAMTEVLDELALSIVRDGEGAEKVVRLEVSGAPSDTAARRVAERVARSLLVKTAVHGADPNWGRILAAAGAAGIAFDPGAVEVRIGGTPVAKRGRRVGEQAEADAARAMKAAEYLVEIKLGAGRGRAFIRFCDIGQAYVRVNAEYTT
jgi:glutamate N-acetyltransferase/amino-acid N-acetyltransferase